MGIGGNSRGYYSLEVYESKDKLEATLSDGNTMLLRVSVFGALGESHIVLGRRLMAQLWYAFGMRKSVSSAAEWNFFQAYWTLECDRRLGIAAAHPAELCTEVYLEHGILYTCTGDLKLMPPCEGTVRVGTSLPNLTSEQHIRQHIASQKSC